MIAVTSETSPLAKSDDYLAAFFMDDYIEAGYSSYHPQSAALFCPWLSDRKYSQHSSRALQQKINFLQTKTYYRTRIRSMR